MSTSKTNWSADAHVRVAGTLLSPMEKCPSRNPKSERIPRRLRTWASALLALLACATMSFAATPALVNSAGTAGGRQTAGTIVVDSAIGGIGGSASVGTFLARHGVAGQLTDLQAVTVSAASTTVNEGATSQLAAAAVFTDASVLPLATSAVAWSVSGGGLASVNSSGLVTAATAYQNTNGVARADYLGQFGTLTLSVVNVGTDDFGTYAGDSVDDAWQVQHFGIGSASAAATADPDGDGQNNLFEYLAGTTPTSGASLFNVTIANTGASQRSVTFGPIAAGRSYTVEYRTNLFTGSFTPASGGTSSGGGTQTFTDASATNSARFYRIRISLP